VQRGQEFYTGTMDAFKKILKYEGGSGLYKGFWINTFQIGLFVASILETDGNLFSLFINLFF
jgi:hypothetical protein